MVKTRLAKHATNYRSSETSVLPIAMHETSVRAIVPLDGLGTVAICGLPGLEIDHDGMAFLSPEHAELTFDYLKHLNAECLYLLMEDMELPPQTHSVLAGMAATARISLISIPIADFGCPDEKFEGVWKAGRDARSDLLKRKKSIGVACLYGAGRSGMMAAAIAAECGIAPEKAVRFVREFYAEAVASQRQEKWVAAGTYLK